jgi:hypothetical protein
VQTFKADELRLPPAARPETRCPLPGC